MRHSHRPVHSALPTPLLRGLLLLASLGGCGWAEDRIVTPITYASDTVVGTTQSTSITTQGQVVVPAGVSVTYQATRVVDMTSGFDAQASGASQFHALTIVPTFTYVAVAPAGGSVAAGAQVQLSATADDQSGYPLATQPTFTWSVHSGGGSVSATGLFQAPAMADTVTVYAQSGGATGTATFSITIANPAPVARYTITQSSPGGVVDTFDASASTGSPALASYAWTFGDGTSGSGRVVSHAFPGSGTYTTALTVTDSGGRVSPSFSATIVVPASQPTYYGPTANVYHTDNTANSLPVGRGWIAFPSGNAFQPDTAQPARFLYFTPVTVAYSAATPTAQNYATDLVSAAVSDTAPTTTTSNCLGKGWIAHDAGGQRLIADHATASSYITLNQYRQNHAFTDTFGTPHQNVPSAYYTWAVTTNASPSFLSEGVLLSQGWIEGALANLQVTPDRSRPARVCFAAARVLIPANMNGYGDGGPIIPNATTYIAWVLRVGELPEPLVLSQQVIGVQYTQSGSPALPPGFVGPLTLTTPGLTNPSRSGVTALGSGYVAVSAGAVTFSP